MPIKVGFSTSVCPGWDIHQIVTQANEMGFYGVELGTVRDELHLPDAEDLQTDKEVAAVRELFEQNSVELVGIASKYSLEALASNVADRMAQRTIENIVLAAKLGAPFVRVPLGRPVDREPVQAALARQIPRLAQVARVAARHEVTLLLVNTAGYPSSRSLWFVVDGVDHPCVRCAWDPVLGLSCQENSTLAIPRLGARIRQVNVNDASLRAHGVFDRFCAVGEGDVDYPLTIDLLRGVLFDGYLMVDWPKGSVDDLPEPGDALPAALAFLLERIQYTAPVLSAYKKDKQAANWSGAVPAFVAREVAVADAEAPEAAGADGGGNAGGDSTPRVPKGGDPKIAAMVAEAVRKVRAARAAKGG